MKKRLLIVTNHSYMFWQFRRELAEALQKEYEVILATPFVGHEEDLQNMGIQCIPISMSRRGINPFAEAKLLWTYGRLLEKIKPDLALTYSIKPNIYIGLICSQKQIPYYANVQGLGTAFEKPVLSSLVTYLYRRAFRKVKYVFFENEENARAFCEKKILSPDRQIILAGAGINLERHQIQPYPKHSKIHFLYLGRIMKEKGIDELFYAVRRLKEEKENFILDLAGFFEEKYKEQVNELEKLEIARFYGFQSDPRPLYREADCVVLPSYHEGMSNVLLEAAAAGRPVITSNIPGCRESVENGKSGLLVEEKNKEMLYQAMKKMLHCSREEREKMGKAGREKMEREFRREAVVERTVRSLEENFVEKSRTRSQKNKEKEMTS